MKQKRTLKKLLCMLVTAAMLFAVIAVQVSAEGEVTISSDYYEIDNENHVISKVLYNTFVGDFMKRIDAGDNVKILKNGDDEVFQGFVTNEMTFYAGNTAYSIEYYSLYSLKDKMNAYIETQGDEFTSETMLSYAYDSQSTFDDQVQSSLIKSAGIFDAGLKGGADEASNDYMTAKVYKNEGEPYLELETNRAQLLYLVTEVLDDYSTDNKYVGKYVVSELDIKSIDYDADTIAYNAGKTKANEMRSGQLAAGHYYLATIGGISDNYAPIHNGSCPLLSNAWIGDMVYFGDKFAYGLTGQYKTFYVGSNMPYLSAFGAYTVNQSYNVKEYNTIFAPGGADTTIDVAKLYVDGTAVASDKSATLNSAVDEINRISKGMLGIGVNRWYKNDNVGTKTTAKINDYRLYLAENFHDAVNKASTKSDLLVAGHTGSSGEKTDEATGFTVSYKPAKVKNVIPNTTTKELRSIINPHNKSAYIKFEANGVQLADNDYVPDGCIMTVYAPTVSESYNSRPYTISLAVYGDVTYTVNEGVYTVTIEANNTVGVTFMAAAYDSSNKIIAAKVFGNGSDTVLFACDNPETIRVFAFKNLETIKPVAASKLATEAVPEP